MITKVKVLGPAGTFGHEACDAMQETLLRQHGEMRIDFVRENVDVLMAAAYHRCFGVVPIYNSDAKLVQGVVRFLLDEHRGLKSHLIGARKLRVRHHLWMHPEIKRPRGQLRGVMSHIHALNQTTAALDDLGLHRQIEVSSTAEAARLVASAREWRRYVAVASEFAGKFYGLKLLRANVEDSPNNFTIFHVFGPEPTRPTKLDRTDLIVVSDNRHDRVRARLGAMRSELPGMRSARPIFGEGGVEAFYCRFDAHRNTDAGRSILREIRKIGDTLVLGSYPIE